MAKKCKICNENDAVLPDRNRMGRFIKEVCRECHAARLRGDMAVILKKHFEEGKSK